jgi:cell fate (sporulation/competence/biofilm development) regulator YlbF (YheA/YmcA/DUF963 family)
MDILQEKAHDLGRLVAQTDEYKALKRANDKMSEDRETVTLLNRLVELQDNLSRALQTGEEPTEEQQQSYEDLVEQLQGRSGYQSMVSAQSNFDRLMMRINEEIGRGIEAGEKSRIILSS